MDIDKILKQIQDIVTNPTPPVIVLGSGASIILWYSFNGESGGYAKRLL